MNDKELKARRGMNVKELKAVLLDKIYPCSKEKRKDNYSLYDSGKISAYREVIFLLSDLKPREK